MLTIIISAACGFVFGALVAWNNTKSSLKAKLDSEIGKATGAAAQALNGFKAKL